MSGNSPTLSRTASPSLDDGVLPSQIRLSGFLWGLSPAPFLVPFIEPGGAFQQILVIGAVFGLAFAGTLSPRSPNLARRVLFVTLLDLLVLLSRPLLTSPALFLIALLVLTAPAWWFWERSRTLGSALDPGHRETVRASGAAQAGLIVWGLVGMHLGTQVQYDQLWPLGLSLAVGMITSAAWLVFEAPRHAARGVLLTLVLGFDVLVGKSVAGDPANWLVFAAIVPLASLLILPPGKLRGRDRVNWLEPVLGHPSRLLVVTFAGFSLLGSILLASPFATVQGRATGLLDAFFTSVSAVCVTGLIVKDTATHFTFGGQLILLGLIQIGGLGIMTFSTAALRLLGRRMSLKTEGAVAGLISAEDRGQLYAATGRLLAFTLACEAVGAGVLTVLFARAGDAGPTALWRGLFTAVSAFCNAGFAIQTESLIPYQTSPLVLHTVALLIIAGGLSPAVALALPRVLRGGGSPVSAQVKIALEATGILLFAGFAFFLATEWSASLRHLGILDRLHNAWFQSVTLRTAGFNSVDLSLTEPATVTLMLIWMFIGGCPGGTAGGIKTTTGAVLVMAVVAAISGRWEVERYGRRIPHKSVYKATAIMTVASSAVFLAVVCLELTQGMPVLMLVFEAVSALGTVGLSIGGTAQLDMIGKCIIIGCMFVGRVGTLTLFLFLSNRTSETSWSRPVEEIEVG